MKGSDGQLYTGEERDADEERKVMVVSAVDKRARRGECSMLLSTVQYTCEAEVTGVSRARAPVFIHVLQSDAVVAVKLFRSGTTLVQSKITCIKANRATLAETLSPPYSIRKSSQTLCNT